LSQAALRMHLESVATDVAKPWAIFDFRLAT
jgi:hypothetical protein